MKILVVGGGSGGHITPVLAVIREILDDRPRSKVEFWTDRKYYKNVTKLTTELGVVSHIRVRRLPAGKFHRYSNWSFKQYLQNLDLVLKDLILGNIIGFFSPTLIILISQMSQDDFQIYPYFHNDNSNYLLHIL